MSFNNDSDVVVTDWFWDLIDRADHDPAKLRTLLDKLTREELVSFAEQFGEAALELSGLEYVQYMRYQSDDDVDELARLIASQGKAFYESILENPELTPTEAATESDPTNFAWVAESLYAEKFGEQMP